MSLSSDPHGISPVGRRYSLEANLSEGRVDLHLLIDDPKAPAAKDANDTGMNEPKRGRKTPASGANAAPLGRARSRFVRTQVAKRVISSNAKPSPHNSHSGLKKSKNSQKPPIKHANPPFTPCFTSCATMVPKSSSEPTVFIPPSQRPRPNLTINTDWVNHPLSFKPKTASTSSTTPSTGSTLPLLPPPYSGQNPIWRRVMEKAQLSPTVRRTPSAGVLSSRPLPAPAGPLPNAVQALDSAGCEAAPNLRGGNLPTYQAQPPVALVDLDGQSFEWDSYSESPTDAKPRPRARWAEDDPVQQAGLRSTSFNTAAGFGHYGWAMKVAHPEPMDGVRYELPLPTEHLIDLDDGGFGTWAKKPNLFGVFARKDSSMYELE